MKEREIIFKCRTGSHLYGLNNPESDEDFVSVFMPLPEDMYGLTKCETIDNSTKASSVGRRNTKDDVDDKMYSLPNFVHLLVQNNPNILELLFATPENIIICKPEFQFLIDNYDKIVSRRAMHAFGGYAFSQKEKLMTKKERYGSLKLALEYVNNLSLNRPIIDWTTETALGAGLSVKTISASESETLNSIIKHYKNSGHECQSFHSGMELEMIKSKLEKELDEYGWRVKTSSFGKLGYDVKFAYHLIRLMAEANQLILTGRITYPITGVDKDTIMEIRNGSISYEVLLKTYELYNEIYDTYKDTEMNVLRYQPDMKFAEKYLVETITKDIIKKYS
jgi:uncharacterized protein